MELEDIELEHLSAERFNYKQAVLKSSDPMVLYCLLSSNYVTLFFTSDISGKGFSLPINGMGGIAKFFYLTNFLLGGGVVHTHHQ